MRASRWRRPHFGQLGHRQLRERGLPELAPYQHGDRAHAFLEHDTRFAVERDLTERRERECTPDRRMAGEWHLQYGREDAHAARMLRITRRIDEHGFRKIHLEGD